MVLKRGLFELNDRFDSLEFNVERKEEFRIGFSDVKNRSVRTQARVRPLLYGVESSDVIGGENEIMLLFLRSLVLGWGDGSSI